VSWLTIATAYRDVGLAALLRERGGAGTVHMYLRPVIPL
jgi:hypothetical protein